jgi:hypothetical protein
MINLLFGWALYPERGLFSVSLVVNCDGTSIVTNRMKSNTSDGFDYGTNGSKHWKRLHTFTLTGNTGVGATLPSIVSQGFNPECEIAQAVRFGVGMNCTDQYYSLEDSTLIQEYVHEHLKFSYVYQDWLAFCPGQSWPITVQLATDTGQKALTHALADYGRMRFKYECEENLQIPWELRAATVWPFVSLVASLLLFRGIRMLYMLLTKLICRVKEEEEELDVEAAEQGKSDLVGDEAAAASQSQVSNRRNQSKAAKAIVHEQNQNHRLAQIEADLKDMFEWRERQFSKPPEFPFPVSKQVENALSVTQMGVASCAREVNDVWVYQPYNGVSMLIRGEDSIDGPKTDQPLGVGETFLVSQMKESDGVTYLKLADGRGWAFDRKPGFGIMCSRVGVARLQETRIRRQALRNRHVEVWPRPENSGSDGAFSEVAAMQMKLDEKAHELEATESLIDEMRAEMDTIVKRLDLLDSNRSGGAREERPASPRGDLDNKIDALRKRLDFVEHGRRGAGGLDQTSSGDKDDIAEIGLWLAFGRMHGQLRVALEEANKASYAAIENGNAMIEPPPRPLPATGDANLNSIWSDLLRVGAHR